MEKCLWIIAFLIMLPRILVSQQTDTIYFDKNWNQATSKNYKYYRIATQKTNLVEVVDYTKSGSVQMTGAYRNMDFSEKIGPFQYYKRDRLEILKIYSPTKYPEILEKYPTQLKYLYVLSDSLILEFRYFKNGRINGIGNMIDECTYSGPYLSFKKNNDIPFCSAEFQNNVRHGKYVWYYRDGSLFLSGEYKNGEKNGVWEWMFDGRLSKTDFWIDGKKVKTLRVE